jgi:hypothetical protein
MISKSTIFIGLAFLMFTSCKQSRIESIIEKSGLELPQEYNFVKTVREESGYAGQDLYIKRILQFEEQDLTYIEDQLDSLVKVDHKWSKHGIKYKYHFQKSKSEIKAIEVDMQTRLLEYSLILL